MDFLGADFGNEGSPKKKGKTCNLNCGQYNLRNELGCLREVSPEMERGREEARDKVSISPSASLSQSFFWITKQTWP